MAIYDPQSNKIVVRVAYDGPARAGKTTNIEQIAELFPRERRSELCRSEESAGQRTLFLDWIQVDSGLVGGHELRCQLLTVPGQAVLTRRRRMLLELADAVVFVTDGSPECIGHTKQMWTELVSLFDGRAGANIPCVLQINKQDLASRLSEAELRRELNCPAAVPIVRAEAARGLGVRESLVLAVRAAAHGVQRALSKGGLEALAGTAEGPEQIRAMIEAEERAAPLAAEELLRRRNQLWTQRGRRSDTAEVRSSSDSNDPAGLPEEACPELPAANVPAGMVWPAYKGRSILRRVPRDAAELRERPAADPAGGGGRFWTFEAGLWCLRSAQHRCYVKADEASAELLRLARFQTQLGPLIPPVSALCVHRSGVPLRFRVWSVAPWLTTVRSRLAFARGHGDTVELLKVLCSYADAVFQASFALGEHCQLDLDPDHFGWLNGQCYYLRDRSREHAHTSNPVTALAERCSELRDFPEVVVQALAHFDAKISALTVLQRQRLAEWAAALDVSPTDSVASISRLFAAG